MRKIFLWGGLIGFIVFVLCFFLAGAMSNGNAVVPAIYGTNQGLWAFLSFVSLVLFFIGLIRTIIHAIKNRQAGQIK